MSFLFIYIQVVLFLVSVYGQNPHVKITEPALPAGVNTVEAETGSIQDFVCVARNKPHNRQVLWYRDRGKPNTTMLLAEGETPRDSRYSVIKPNSISWKFRIKNVQLSMDGAYICMLQHTTHSEIKDVIYLSVTEKPRIRNIETSFDNVVSEGESITLVCKGDGIPKPVIKWTRLALANLPNGGKELRHEELKIEQAKAEHRGKYICQADNKAGHAQRIINLKVKFSPIISPREQTVYQALGYAKVINCDIEAYPQPTHDQVTWSRADQDLTLDDNFITRTTLGSLDSVRARLYIRRVSEEHYGDYICSVRNSAMKKNVPAVTGVIKLRRSEVPQVEPSLYSSTTQIIASIITNVLVVLVAFRILH